MPNPPGTGNSTERIVNAILCRMRALTNTVKTTCAATGACDGVMLDWCNPETTAVIYAPCSAFSRLMGGRSTSDVYWFLIGPRSNRQKPSKHPKIVQPSTKKNRKKLRYEKINPDAYAKWTAGRVAATPALQSIPVGPAPCTPQGPACRLLEYPHLAVARAHGAKAPRRFPRAHWGSHKAPHFLTSRAFWNDSTL